MAIPSLLENVISLTDNFTYRSNGIVVNKERAMPYAFKRRFIIVIHHMKNSKGL